MTECKGIGCVSYLQPASLFPQPASLSPTTAITAADLPTPPKVRVLTAEELLQKSTRISSSARAALQHVRDTRAISLGGQAAEDARSGAKDVGTGGGLVPLPVGLPEAQVQEDVPVHLRGLVSSAMAERLRAKEKRRTEQQLRLDSSALQRAHRIAALPPLLSVVWAETK